MPDLGVPYKQFLQRHPDYDQNYWRRCRALYAGGDKLLRNQHVMRDVFPPHAHEAPDIYAARTHLAHYTNYSGSIIDKIVAALFKERLTITALPEPDPFYAEFFQDVTRPGGKVVSLNDFLKHQVLTALQCGVAWTLVEFPRLSESRPESLAEEERMGLLSAYASPVDPECVRDWEESEDGAIQWVLLAFQRQKRAGLTQSRGMVEEEFIYYRPEGYERYLIRYEEGKGPKETDLVPMVESGPLSFGAVPLIKFELSAGLYAMGKLESNAVAHFNLENGLDWAMYKSLFPVLHVFEGPEVVGNVITEDPGRAVNQVRGQGYVVRMGSGDRVEYVGPDASPYVVTLQRMVSLRDEMYRVVHQMADSVDNSGAALRRSGESKAVDQASAAIVLQALGQAGTKHTLEILRRVALGRRDPDYDWGIKGMDEFEGVSLTSILDEATVLDTVSVPSARFWQIYKFKLAKIALGDDAMDGDLRQIRAELERAITQERYEMPMPMLSAKKEPDEEDEPDEDEDEEDEDKDEAMKGPPRRAQPEA